MTLFKIKLFAKQSSFHIRCLHVLCNSNPLCHLHQDGNGYIDEQELDALLKDLCDKNKMVMNLLIDRFRLLFCFPNTDAWDLMWHMTMAAVPGDHLVLANCVCLCGFWDRTWTQQDWAGTRQASWLCPTEGNCTALSWRSSCVGTPCCKLPAWDGPLPHGASSFLPPEATWCMRDP